VSFERLDLPFPAPPAEYSRGFMSSLISSIQRSIRGVQYTQNEKLYLVSPDGALWKVTVSNAGALVVAAADKADARPPL